MGVGFKNIDGFSPGRESAAWINFRREPCIPRRSAKFRQLRSQRLLLPAKRVDPRLKISCARLFGLRERERLLELTMKNDATRLETFSLKGGERVTRLGELPGDLLDRGVELVHHFPHVTKIAASP
jgi:hypothetical protein